MTDKPDLEAAVEGVAHRLYRYAMGQPPYGEHQPVSAEPWHDASDSVQEAWRQEAREAIGPHLQQSAQAERLAEALEQIAHNHDNSPSAWTPAHAHSAVSIARQALNEYRATQGGGTAK